MYITLFQILFAFIVLVTILTQILWPGLTGKPIFPIFRKRKLESELAKLAEQQEIEALNAKINEIKNKNNKEGTK